MWYKNIAGMFFGLVTKHACDGRTNGLNYDSQDRASIAASRGKKFSYTNTAFDFESLITKRRGMWKLGHGSR